MKTLRTLTLATAGLIALTGMAFAHELDIDQDGLYSLTEMQTEYPDLTQEQYDALDTNKDGAIDAEELAAAIESGALPEMD